MCHVTSHRAGHGRGFVTGHVTGHGTGYVMGHVTGLVYTDI